MVKSYSDDFKVTTNKKGGGGRKQNKERKNSKNKRVSPIKNTLRLLCKRKRHYLKLLLKFYKRTKRAKLYSIT